MNKVKEYLLPIFEENGFDNVLCKEKRIFFDSFFKKLKIIKFLLILSLKFIILIIIIELYFVIK